jgi:hypothetical protein
MSRLDHLEAFTRSWRIVVAPEKENSLNLIMYNITPAGEEALAIKAVYAKVAM